MGDRSFEFSQAATVDAAGDWHLAATPFTTQSTSDLFG
jgi:hypothetical protein